MGWNSRQREEALLRETPERSSGSRSETERSVGDELSKAAAPAGPGAAAAKPDPEVSVRPSRRRFTAAYKLVVLQAG